MSVMPLLQLIIAGGFGIGAARYKTRRMVRKNVALLTQLSIICSLKHFLVNKRHSLSRIIY